MINESRIKELLIFIALSISFISFGAEVDAQANRSLLLSSIYFFVDTFITLLGIIFMISSVIYLKKHGDDPNATKGYIKIGMIGLVCSALLFNYQQTASIMINSTIGDKGGFCMIMDDSNSSSKVDSLEENCWDVSTSEITEGIESKVDSINKANVENNLVTLIAVFQLIGLAYFVKSILLFFTISKGQTKETYGKAFLMLTASALVIDLPHTLELIRGTVIYLGIGSY